MSNNMKAISNLVGTKISFDEAGYNQNVRLFGGITAQANIIISLYNQLPHEKRKIDKDFLIDLNNARAITIEKEMVAYGESEIKRMGWKLQPLVDSCRESVYKELEPIKEAFKKYDVILQQSQISHQYTYVLDLDLLDIVDGRAELTDTGKEKLKIVYSIFIDNDEQAEVWAAMQKTQTAFNELGNLLSIIGVPIHPNLNPICSPRGFIHEGEGNQLELHPQAIAWLKSFMSQTKREKATA